MATIVILGAGIGGISQAFELKPMLNKGDRLIVISDQDRFEFTPSNPWVAMGWRSDDQITVPLPALFKKHGIEFVPTAVADVRPADDQLDLADGTVIDYDYLVIATGPRLAFDEIDGLGPDGHTVSICKTAHASKAHHDVEALIENPGPVIIGAAQGASCFGPAYEYAFILDTELRNRHIGWITNAKIDRIEANAIALTEVDAEGTDKKQHQLQFQHAMILPAFTGIDALRDVEGLVNPRGFIVVDEFQRNPAYSNTYAVGVCIAIPPVGETPLPVGVPKTGFMIESIVAATAQNIRDAMAGREPSHRATWNAVCLADFGDGGVAFVASPQIPPRNISWASKGKWVHLAKVGFEKYFLRKVRQGKNEPFYEKQIMKWIGADKLRPAP